MIAIFLAPLYILVNIYLIWRFFRWLGLCHEKLKWKRVRIPTAIVYAFFAVSVLIGFLYPKGQAKRNLTLIGNYSLGILLHTLLVIPSAEVVLLLLKHSKKKSRKSALLLGGTGILLIAGISTWGMVNARIIHTTNYTIHVAKEIPAMKSLQIVLAADLHMGYNIGSSHIRQTVDKINAEHPDLVVIAGDIFDNEYDALDNPDELISLLRNIHSRYGVYACYGNHDIHEKILAGFTFGGKSSKKVSDIRMDEFLKKANIQLLQDDYVLIDDSFYLYGRADYERPGRGITTRKTPEELTSGMDLSKPVIVLDHEPRELQELADAGVDVDLCGHTHDGQTFPGNLTTHLTWENSAGYLKKGQMHNIVTSGVGVFGPFMRVGTKAEICSIAITFE